MNVALTRARHALYVFGHMRTLKVGEYSKYPCMCCFNRGKECTSSLVLLPPRNFAVFERQRLVECYTQRANTQAMY